MPVPVLVEAKGIGSLGAGVIDGCERFVMGVGNWTWVLSRALCAVDCWAISPPHPSYPFRCNFLLFAFFLKWTFLLACWRCGCHFCLCSSLKCLSSHMCSLFSTAVIRHGKCDFEKEGLIWPSDPRGITARHGRVQAEQLAAEGSHLKPQALAETVEWVRQVAFKHKSPSPVTYFLQLPTPPKAVQIAPPTGAEDFKCPSLEKIFLIQTITTIWTVYSHYS